MTEQRIEELLQQLPATPPALQAGQAPTIRTDGVGGGSVETEHEPGQSTGDWVRDHSGKVASGGVAGVDTLKTTWPVDSGPPKRHITIRDTNENDQTFKNRHIIEYLEIMLNCPPAA